VARGERGADERDGHQHEDDWQHAPSSHKRPFRA
jgi:hypothetical protein